MKNNFYDLTPDEVLNAVESLGLIPTGEFHQLNSYENRVFEISLEGGISEESKKIIVKFYRPSRWSQEALQDEHDFLRELKEEGVPAIAPYSFQGRLIQNQTGVFRKSNDFKKSIDGRVRLEDRGSACEAEESIETLEGMKSVEKEMSEGVSSEERSIFFHKDIYWSLFPKFFGRMPQELLPGDFKKIGRSLAQIHNVGSRRRALFRPEYTAQEYGFKSLEILKKFVSPEVWFRYEVASKKILNYLERKLNPESFIRIHGDCHRGNLLKEVKSGEPENFFFVDFDDFCNGPEAQDFWMLISHDQFDEELDDMLSGYTEIRNFDENQIELFEPLRGLRIIHYAKWIAMRWEDPSFPKIFPDFETYNYWAQETEQIEKIAWSL